MKRFGLVLALALIFVLAISGVAMAANPHGNYTTNTNSCVQCHATHTAATAKLIGFSSTYTSAIATNPNNTYKLCVYCHQGGATQSKYDVVDGQIKTGDASNDMWASVGGGVEKMPKTEGPSTAIPAIDVVNATSQHNVFAAPGTLVAVPGNNQAAGAQMELWCSSCHDPHGTSNSRQLKGSFKRLNTDNTTWTNITVPAINIAVTNPLAKETVTYNNALSDFCAACHVDYMQGTGAGSTASGTYSSKYRHPVATTTTNLLASTAPGYDATKLVLPVSTTGGLICTTCHNAHGTTSTASSGSSSLLNLDERGVCQNCHNKTKDGTAPTFADRDGVAVGTQATLADSTHVIVSFTGYMLKSGAETIANYSITGPAAVTISGAALQPDGKSVMLTTSAAVVTTGTYTVKVTTTGISDTNGNTTVANGPIATFVK